MNLVNNPFNLITDEELDSSHAAINHTWKSGESGNFVGVDNVKIEYKIFKHPKEIATIVISSGRTESYIKYKELIYDLNRLGYTVYIHDH
jgi:lysophospholipase